MNKNQILGIARHILTFVGGFLVVRGYVDESTLTEIIGSVVTLAGLVWSVADKTSKKDGSEG
jgi:uncharacterized membrane protein